MPSYANPADRLLTILQALAGRPTNSDLQSAWAQALGIPTDAVETERCRAASLIPQIIDTVHAANDEHQIRNVNLWGPRWGKALMTPMGSPVGSSGINQEMLIALGGIASYLRLAADEGSVPDQEQIAELRDRMSALLQEVRDSEDLPTGLKVILIRRLYDIVAALDHVYVVGPDGVQAAVERLACGLDFEGGAPGPDGLFERIKSTLRMAYAAFRTGHEVHQALEGWSNTAQRVLGS
ncbi:hypothetical protein [Streptomyces sp. B22F1]|uniref:hypothetical protein n=1 Tax=Streptomyces sp. B22F1 TaxID=3153566 RepID=UPI00325EC487